MPFNEEYFNSEDFKELLNYYEASMKVGEHPFMDVDDLVDIADYYNHYERADEAIEVIEHALQLYPSATLPNVFMARQALMDCDYNMARHYSDCIEDQDDPDYHYLQAEILIAEGQQTNIFVIMRRGSIPMNIKIMSKTVQTFIMTMVKARRPLNG